MSNKPVEIKDENKEQEKKKKKRTFWIVFVVAFFICAIVTILVGVLDIYSKGLDWDYDRVRIIADSFFVGGILGVLMWLLIWVSRAGVFDMVVYGTRKLFNYFFKKNPEDSTLPHTYYDYVVLKGGKKRDNFFGFLIVAGVYLIVGIILSFVTIM